jgi:ribosome-associated toxin RatA of RatAB toxin-antitoxin module
MAHVSKSVLVSHSAELMFDLVDDVEQYPAFLPWCGGARVHSRDDVHTDASVDIRYLGVSQSFRTRNTKSRPRQMALALVEGPFQSLTGAWQFTPLTPEACKVEFVLDYAFGNPLVESVIGPVMSMIAETFVDRFVQRADQLHPALSQ